MPNTLSVTEALPNIELLHVGGEETFCSYETCLSERVTNLQASASAKITQKKLLQKTMKIKINLISPIDIV